jgi:two-component system response regulator TctD
MRILLVEDSSRLRGLLTECLLKAGYVPDAVATAAEFEQHAAAGSYTAYVIDLGLPDLDGMDLIERRRDQSDTTPILVVTARASIPDRIIGLDHGADDYLVKPFNHDEFLARLRALLRRPAQLAPPEISSGGLKVCAESGEASYRGERIALRPTEARLLKLLVQRKGRIVPRSTIEAAIFRLAQDCCANTIDQVVSRLRRALGERSPALQIKTIKGTGYTLDISSDALDAS